MGENSESEEDAHSSMGGGARAACSMWGYARLPRPDRRGYYKNRVLCTLVVAEDSEG